MKLTDNNAQEHTGLVFSRPRTFELRKRAVVPTEITQQRDWNHVN